MSELAAESGVAVPTIKFYLREGLVAPGERVSATRARYDEGHVRRLRLIRALVDSAGLSLERVRQVLAAVDDPPADLVGLLGEVVGGDDSQATPRADVVVAELGWDVPPGCASMVDLEAALEAVGSSGFAPPRGMVALMGRLADQLAAAEVAGIPAEPPEAAAEYVLVGTALMAPVLLALRSVGHVHHSVERFGHSSEGQS